jgi:ApaG protein
MEGAYYMVIREPREIDPQDLPTFEVPIAPFSLHTPTALN